MKLFDLLCHAELVSASMLFLWILKQVQDDGCLVQDDGRPSQDGESFLARHAELVSASNFLLIIATVFSFGHKALSP